MLKFSCLYSAACLRSVVLLTVVGVTAPRCWAWGREGHRLTALVAEHYLTPEAQRQIAELLAADSKEKETLVNTASWADEYRLNHPDTGKWHYVDIPKDQTTFDRRRDCPVSETEPQSPWRDCVTDRIRYFEGRLGDTELTLKERAVALKFLVHLIGDVHQPFHAVGDDRGGNNVAVSFMGSPLCGDYKCNLHGVWDDALIQSQGLSERKYVERLLGEIEANQWQNMNGGDPATWANISHHYAVNAYAPNGALLTHEYVADEAKVVDAELALGGLRLARVLNRILGETAVVVPGAIMPPKP